MCFEKYYTPGEIEHYGGKPILVPTDNMMPVIDDVISELEIIRDSSETNMIDIKAVMLISAREGYSNALAYLINPANREKYARLFYTGNREDL